MNIVEVDETLLEDVLPLIETYQRFYGVEHICQDRNKNFFRNFTSGSQNGIIHAATIDDDVVGF